MSRLLSDKADSFARCSGAALVDSTGRWSSEFCNSGIISRRTHAMHDYFAAAPVRFCGIAYNRRRKGIFVMAKAKETKAKEKKETAAPVAKKAAPGAKKSAP